MFCRVEGCAGKPPGLVSIRQRVHQDLKAILAFGFAGGQQILHQLEYADDVPPLLGSLLRGRQILRQQENDRREQSLGCIVKKRILAVV